ncbi:MAG: hypothetical protein IPN34_16540 [Planctomycetes bacterium]|nr:hypothetical protein [Planctomycetota bacterium]
MELDPQVEEERLFGMAQSAMLLSMLPSRRAPAALDAVLEELDDLEPELEGPDVSWGPDLLASFQQDEARVGELMAKLRPQLAPAALDAHFEAELALRETALAPAGDRTPLLGAPASPSPNLFERSASAAPRPGGSSTGLRLVWRRRLAWAAAAALLGAIGFAIFSRGGAQGEEGGARNASRFSFRYINVETAGADVANRPALRLLRGWASHISPDALESSSAPK